jgi:hypothetical protein
MISDLDEAIKQLLIKKGGLDPTEVDICFEMPDREWSASISKPTINVYLYDIQENHELRNNEWTAGRNNNGMATKRKPPVRVDLSYLITVWTNDVTDQHRLLGHLLATLFRYHELPEELLQGSLREVQWPIKASTAQPDGVLRNSADFWSALDNQLKPSINYVVTIPVDLDVTLTAPVVKTKTLEFKGSNRMAPEDFVQISGFVRYKGKPDQGIANAMVLVKELQMTASADESGKYIFTKLSPGSYTFQVSAPGEKKREIQVAVPSASYDIEL